VLTTTVVSWEFLFVLVPWIMISSLHEKHPWKINGWFTLQITHEKKGKLGGGFKY